MYKLILFNTVLILFFEINKTNFAIDF